MTIKSIEPIIKRKVLIRGVGTMETIPFRYISNGSLKVLVGNLQSSESKILKIDGRSEPRSQKQIDTFKRVRLIYIFIPLCKLCI
jgi:hypothetical protein